jgi:TolB protein
MVLAVWTIAFPAKQQGEQNPEQRIRIELSDTIIAVPDFQPKRNPVDPVVAEALKTVNEVLRNDLKYSGFFVMASQSFYPLKPLTGFGDANYSDWKIAIRNLAFLIAGNVELSNGELRLEGHVLDAKQEKEAFANLVRGGPDQAREMAHRLADIIVFKLTAGQSRGIATTKIAFSSQRGKGREVYVMDYDGYNQHPLTRFGGESMSPDWSPDNSKVAFSIQRGNNPPEIYIVSTTDGSRSPFPLFNSFVSAPAFSPDGQKIAFAMRDPKTNFPNIYVSGINGTDRINITNSKSIDTSPAWSPKGNQIAFVSSRGGTPTIYVCDTDGANVRKLLNRGGEAQAPDWSPDGQYITYFWKPERGAPYDIYIAEVATGRIFQLTSGKRNNEYPSWSPDGRHIVFQSDRTGTPQIYTMLMDGSDQKQLTNSGRNTFPAWSKYYN